MPTPNQSSAALLLGLGLLTSLTSCQSPAAVYGMMLQDPSPHVGERTLLTLNIQSSFGQTPIFYYMAQRGRIVGMNGETAQAGQFVRAGNVVRYYAPFTSSYPAPDGIRQGDTITVKIQNSLGGASTSQSLPVPLIGTTMVFSAASGNQAAAGQNSTLMLSSNLSGSFAQPQPLVDLTNNPILGSSPAISPDGSRIAYVFYPGDGTSKIMMLDASGQTQALTTYNSGLSLDPAWSPDGRFLLFSSNQDAASNGIFNLYEMSVDPTQGSQAVTRLTNDTWDERHPAWNPVPGAPDNQAIALSARKNDINSPGGRGQSWNVYLMGSHGNYTKAISSVQGDGSDWAIEPSWRPDGQAVAYTRYGPVLNYQSNAGKFQRIFVQSTALSTTLTPLNINNTNPISKESSPIWSINPPNNLLFLMSNGNLNAGAQVYLTTYLPGPGSVSQPQLLPIFQSIPMALVGVDSTNQNISGFHPLDWR